MWQTKTFKSKERAENCCYGDDTSSHVLLELLIECSFHSSRPKSVAATAQSLKLQPARGAVSAEMVRVSAYSLLNSGFKASLKKESRRTTGCKKKKHCLSRLILQADQYP